MWALNGSMLCHYTRFDFVSPAQARPAGTSCSCQGLGGNSLLLPSCAPTPPGLPHVAQLRRAVDAAGGQLTQLHTAQAGVYKPAATRMPRRAAASRAFRRAPVFLCSTPLPTALSIVW